MTHAHHWLIETPSGALSRGRCRECGAERDFANYEADTSKQWKARGIKGLRTTKYTTKGDYVR